MDGVVGPEREDVDRAIGHAGEDTKRVGKPDRPPTGPTSRGWHRRTSPGCGVSGRRPCRVAGQASTAAVDLPVPIGAPTHLRRGSLTRSQGRTRVRTPVPSTMVATAVALQQMEKGDLDLDAPVDTYCPESADIQVLDGFDGATPRLHAPASRATVKQLITHTAGFGYWFWNNDLVTWESVTGTPNVLSGADIIFTAPMVADPGAAVHPRHQHRLARQGRRGRRGHDARRRGQGGHHGPARDEEHRVPGGRGLEGHHHARSREGRRRRTARLRHRAQPDSGVLRGQPRPLLHPHATTSGSSACCWVGASSTTSAS